MERVIIRLIPLGEEINLGPEPHNFGQGMEARTAWRKAMIERQKHRVKPTLDAFYIWLQQPEQDSLLNRFISLEHTPISPTIIATVNKAENIVALAGKIKRYPDIESVIPDRLIHLDKPHVNLP